MPVVQQNDEFKDAARTMPTLSKEDADTNPELHNSMWEFPLFLPAGSIRSIIALTIVLTVQILYLRNIPVPEALVNVMMVVIGFYFGSKQK